MKQTIKPQYPSVIAVALLLLLFTFVLSYLLVLDASYPLDWKLTREFNFSVKTCEEAEKKAEEDFKRGIARMYFSNGAFEERASGFPDNFYLRLEKDYGIDVIYTGDVMSSHFKCYNLRMDDLLDEKLGKNTIENLFNKLRDEEYLR